MLFYKKVIKFKTRAISRKILVKLWFCNYYFFRFMDIMEVFKPNMYVTLSVSETNLDSSSSTIEKSVNMSNRLFKSCLERHLQSEVNIFNLSLKLTNQATN